MTSLEDRYREVVRQGVGGGDGLSPGLDPYGPPLVRKFSSDEPQTSSSALHASCEPAIVSQLRSGISIATHGMDSRPT